MKTVNVEKQANLIGGAIKSRFKASGRKVSLRKRPGRAKF